MQTDSDGPGTPPGSSRSRLGKALYGTLGCVFTALGIIGAFLPVMPTTVFLIIALWFFSRSSPRLEAWMLNHRHFGAPLRQWREHGAIPRRAKYFAVSGMALGFVVFWTSTSPGPLLGTVVAVFLVGSAIYVGTRPEC